MVGRISPVALFAAYAVMSFPDGIGVMAARFGMEGSASTLMFLWFALLPIPAGKLCGRMGGRRAVALSLAVALPAFVLLWQGQPQSTVVASGFALAGIANVLLQTSVPVWAAELFGAVRLSGWLTAGLFVRMAVAMSVPFAVAALRLEVCVSDFCRCYGRRGVHGVAWRSEVGCDACITRLGPRYTEKRCRFAEGSPCSAGGVCFCCSGHCGYRIQSLRACNRGRALWRR